MTTVLKVSSSYNKQEGNSVRNPNTETLLDKAFLEITSSLLDISEYLAFRYIESARLINSIATGTPIFWATSNAQVPADFRCLRAF